MSIEQRYFPGDKNYLLKTVQAFSKESLLDLWVEQIFDSYMLMENPMGLRDDFTLKLKAELPKRKSILDSCYDLLCAIFRFRNGDNQLSFLWDGRTHMEYYDEEWKKIFQLWIMEISCQKELYRGVIKIAVAGSKTNTEFLENGIKRALLAHFKVRMTKTQRIMAKSA